MKTQYDVLFIRYLFCLNLIFSELYIIAKLIKTQIFLVVKYDLEGQERLYNALLTKLNSFMHFDF